VITESNEHYRLCRSTTICGGANLRRTTTCCRSRCFLMTNFEGAGRPEHTPWFRDLVADAEEAGTGEQARVPNRESGCSGSTCSRSTSNLIAPWMEQEWGVSVVMDMVSYCPYTLIDTSTEESMSGAWPSAGHGPADIRQAGAGGQLPGGYQPHRAGLPDRLRDLAGAYRPQDGAASVSLMRELCREMTAVLQIGMDQFGQAVHQPRPDQGEEYRISSRPRGWAKNRRSIDFLDSCFRRNDTRAAGFVRVRRTLPPYMDADVTRGVQRGAAQLRAISYQLMASQQLGMTQAARVV